MLHDCLENFFLLLIMALKKFVGTNCCVQLGSGSDASQPDPDPQLCIYSVSFLIHKFENLDVFRVTFNTAESDDAESCFVQMTMGVD